MPVCGCGACPACRGDASQTPPVVKRGQRPGALWITMEIPGEAGWGLWERLEGILNGTAGQGDDHMKVTVLGTEVNANLAGYWHQSTVPSSSK